MNIVPQRKSVVYLLSQQFSRLFKKVIILPFALFINPLLLTAQQMQPVFRHLTPSAGLNNETVRGITQDKYGFMWFGSTNGLFRFDGINIKAYYAVKGDSASLMNNNILCLFNDSKGRLWIGQEPGCCIYEYSTGRFTHFQNTGTVYTIAEDRQGTIWAATSRGLKKLIPGNPIPEMPVIKADSFYIKTLSARINDICVDKTGNLFAATPDGLVMMNTGTYACSAFTTVTSPSVKSNDVQAVAVDADNAIWFSTDITFSTLYTLSPDHKIISNSNCFLPGRYSQNPNRILKIFADNKNRIWVGSTFSGLGLLSRDNKCTFFTNDPASAASIASDFCSAIFQDRQGMLWVSAVGSGVDYFHPDRSLFSAIIKRPHEAFGLLDNWGRAAAEDDKGNLWLGTAQGVSVYNFSTGVIKNFANTSRENKLLTSTSIRALANGNDGTMWVGTADGLSRIDASQYHIIAYGEEDGLPAMFVHSLEKTTGGDILIGGNRGLYEYKRDQKKFISLFSLPALKSFAGNVIKCVKEDSRGWWWIGTFAKGAVVYNPAAQKILYEINETSYSLSSNAVNSFCEDQNGNMWIGTRQGLNYFNIQAAKNTVYTEKEGLLNTWISGMAEDNSGRIWVGSGNGLYVINNERRIFHSFTVRDGLSSEAFNDQAAYRLKNGSMVFPSRKGFIVFDPARFNWQQEIPEVYITSLKIAGKELEPENNIEETEKVKLRYNQNFFTIEMNALYFNNPAQCIYAYKLDGIDKEWIYTKERVVNYTSLPGGKYIFRYKTTADPSQWSGDEKKLVIVIDTIFYKRVWFLLIVVMTLAALLFMLYRFRLNKQRQILQLESKTQSLEKEKTQVQYENLKQQLNPHFLFNSLSSLRSLIRMNPALATDFLDSLSKTYRYLLRSGANELVPLQDEISFVETFVQLQKTRFEEGLQLKVDIPELLMNKRIAPVTIQGLIENAIKHNKIDEETPLVIEVFAENENIVVRNNLQKIAQVETSNKKGLAALKTLYSYLTSKPLEIIEEVPFFTVRIPLL